MALKTFRRRRSRYHPRNEDKTHNKFFQMHSFVLPIVQGHFQASSFDLPTNSYVSEHDSVSRVDYLIASRRSRYRAGLRYQRRGVDDEAHVANFVETETIMRIKVRHDAQRTTRHYLCANRETE